MLSINWKSRTTWTGIAGIVAAVGGYCTGELGGAAAVAGVLAALGAIFMRDAIKPAAGLLVVSLMLGACATAPAQQKSAEESGRSDVRQDARTIQNDLRNLLPKTMTIESPGEVSFVFNFYGNERSSDISQTNSGSTTATQGSEQGVTSTPTNTVSPSTNVSGLPGQ